MYAQLAFEAVTIAGGVGDPLIGSSPDQAPSLASFARTVFYVAVALSLSGVVFGLGADLALSRFTRAGNEPQVFRNFNGRLIVVVSVVALVISLPGLVLLSVFTS